MVAQNPLLNIPYTIIKLFGINLGLKNNFREGLIITLGVSMVFGYLRYIGNSFLFAFDILLIFACFRYKYTNINPAAMRSYLMVILTIMLYGLYVEYREFSAHDFNFLEMVVNSEVWIDGYGKYNGSINGLFYNLFLMCLCLNVYSRNFKYIYLAIAALIVGNIVTGLHAKAPLLALILAFGIIQLDKMMTFYKYILIGCLGMLLIIYQDQVFNIINEQLDTQNNMRIEEYSNIGQSVVISRESTYLRIAEIYGPISLILFIGVLIKIANEFRVRRRKLDDSQIGNRAELLFYSIVILMAFSSDGLLLYLPPIYYTWIIVLKALENEYS